MSILAYQSKGISLFKMPTLDNQTENHHIKAHTRRKKKKLVRKTYFEPSKLYNMLLEYKLYMCSLVVLNETVTSLQRIDVYWQNDYPCIMVQVREHIFENKDGERKSLYKILMAKFTDITNRIANEKAVPIKLGFRPKENGGRILSLDHNNPSVSGTENCFRINIGLIPEVYATEVLVESLEELDEKFEKDEFKNKEGESKSLYKLRMVQNTALTDLLADEKKVPIKMGFRSKENEGRSLSLEHNNQSVSGTENNFRMNIGLVAELDEIIEKILNSTLEDETENTRIHNQDQNVHYYSENFRKDEHEEIKDDRIFWNLIEKIKNGLDDYDSDSDREKEQNLDENSLDFNLMERKLYGLYDALKDANENFKRHSREFSNEDETGYGSDSDCEFQIPTDDPIYYSKKIITSTGTKAIEFATICSKLLAGDHSRIDTKFMHHKTKRIFCLVWPDALKTENSTDKHKKMMYIDLNYCSFNGNHEESYVDLPKIQREMIKDLGGSKNNVIVFDITSAKTEKVKMAINLFAPHVNVVLLVSLENEPIGADMNPYGTIRIISDNRSTVVGLFEALKSILSDVDKLPNKLHSIRAAYKRIGAVLTTKAFCDRSLHFTQRGDPISAKEWWKIVEFTGKMEIAYNFYMELVRGYDLILSAVLTNCMGAELQEEIQFSFGSANLSLPQFEPQPALAKLLPILRIM